MNVSRDPFEMLETYLIECRFVHETASFDFQRAVLNDVKCHLQRLMFTGRGIIRGHGRYQRRFAEQTENVGEQIR